MSRTLALTLVLFVLAVSVWASADGETERFSPLVDGKGGISLPEGFRTDWTHLGSWVVPAASDRIPGFHDVYAEKATVESYKANGRLPDGAAVVMEVRKVAWKEMATGHVVSEGDVDRWFVMVKDDKGRFPGNGNWGDGWGWASFTPEDPSKNLARDYRDDCLACHERERANGLVHVWGYPALR